MSEFVVLVPGVGMGGVEMIPMGRHLERSGLPSKVFWHQPWPLDPSESARRLRDSLERIDADAVHLVGHSMGGVAILRMLEELEWNRPGRVVTLASPLSGFTAVRRVSAVPGGKHVAGKAAHSVRDAGEIGIAGDREIGGIAGNMNLCFGHLLAPGEASDTLVCVHETKLAGMRDHAVFRQTHASMLLAPPVWRAVEHFLRHGAFPHADDEPDTGLLGWRRRKAS
jgi:pimeloyl-ACP methyl ester carboxylesterase